MDAIQAYDGDGVDPDETGRWSAVDRFHIDAARAEAEQVLFTDTFEPPMPRVTFADVRAARKICWQRGAVCFLGMRVIDILQPLWWPPLRQVCRFITYCAVVRTRQLVKKVSRP